jgi:hypothetical protein
MRVRYGPIFPKTPACYGFSIIAKIIPGREPVFYEYAENIEKAVAGQPDILAGSSCIISTNPSINMLEASGNGRSPLVQAEVVLRAFSFGPFRIIPHARLVERDGSPMPLDSRAFDLLCVLVQSPWRSRQQGRAHGQSLARPNGRWSSAVVMRHVERASRPGAGPGFVIQMPRESAASVAIPPSRGIRQPVRPHSSTRRASAG